MGLLAANFNAVPAHMLNTGDHTHLEIFRFEYGALLNMQFEGGVHRLAGKVRAELSNTLQFVLYDVSARDPFVFSLVFAVLAFVGLLASFIPARRATKVDPLIALTAE